MHTADVDGYATLRYCYKVLSSVKGSNVLFWSSALYNVNPHTAANIDGSATHKFCYRFLVFCYKPGC